MAQHRSASGAPDEVHDDDELADVLAAELQRYATGAQPTIPAPRLADLPAQRSEPASAVERPAPQPGFPQPAEPQYAAPQPAEPQRPVPVPVAEPLVPGPSLLDDAEEAPVPSRSSGRRAAEPAQPFGPPPPVDAAPSPEPSGRRVRDVLTWSDAEGRPLPSLPPEEPVRRRRGYLPPSVAEMPPVEPMERVQPTGPIDLPEVTAALLHEMVADQGGPGAPRARHASAPRPAPDVPLTDTGSLAVPRGLYSDWEQSLRSIGRPRSPWEDDDEQTAVRGDVDAPTVSMAVPQELLRPTGPAPRQPADEPDPGPATGRVRRVRRRAEPPAGPAPEPPRVEPIAIVTDAASDDEGVDDVVTEHHRISAAASGAIDLPVVEPRPRTAPVLIERVRTAILQLPVVPPSPTGSSGAGVAGRWVGAFATPVLLLAAFALGAAGAGPVDALPLLLGAAVLTPAAVRSAAWSVDAEPGAREEADAFGGTAGTAWGALLLLARVAAAGGAVFAAASIASAWVARTGAVGGSASGAGLAAAVAVGLIATGAALLPVRAVAIAVQAVGALALVGTVLLLLLLAPSADGSGTGAPVAAAAVGALVPLLVLLCGSDLARWPTAIASTVGAAAGTVVGVVGGALVLALGLLVATGASGDPADALASALSDGTAAVLAGPLAVVLLLASIVLPLLLVRSAGASAGRLLGSGERLGTAAAGLLALAGALGLLSAGVAAGPALLAVAGFAGAPVAAWAGVRTAGGGGRSPVAAAVAAAGVLASWALTDGLLPGLRSPLLAAAGLPPGVAGGPALGLVAAFALGAVAGLLSRGPARTALRRSADTVEG